MLENKTITVLAIFGDIVKFESTPLPCLTYTVKATSPGGHTRLIAASVLIRYPGHLTRLKNEFQTGDSVQLILSKNPATPDFPVTLVDFSRSASSVIAS